MGSFDGGFGSSYLARVVGQKKAREIWFLCRQYGAQEALDMGLVNAVVPVADLEAEGVKWANEILDKSPLAIRLLKSGFNAELDGQAGIQELAGNATLLYYMSEEAKHFMTAQREKRKPDAGSILGCPEEGRVCDPRFHALFFIWIALLPAAPRDAVPHPDAGDGVPLLQPIDHVHPRHHLSEHGIAGVEMRLRRVRDEELAAAGVLPVERHADGAPHDRAAR